MHPQPREQTHGLGTQRLKYSNVTGIANIPGTSSAEGLRQSAELPDAQTRGAPLTPRLRKQWL